MGRSTEFVTGHHDRVTVLHTNFNGTRILTASIDHRIKVWQREPKTGERTLIDTFTAHDADIRDAKFLHPTLGSHIASIGNDLKFHLWTEDVSQAPNSGRRFRRTSTIPSTPRVPFVSMDLKTVDNIYTTLALIDRQGLLSIYEPTSPDDLKDWTLVDTFNVCGSSPPTRGDETSFKVRFDPNPTPLAYMNSLSDDRGQLSLVVSVLNEFKIYRSVVPGGDSSSSSIGGGVGNDGASHRVMFFEAARSRRHPAIIRDVAWAPFSVRGTDRIVTACKDGAVRIFELSVTEAPGSGSTIATADTTATDIGAPGDVVQNASTRRQLLQQQQQQQQQQQHHQSSLTTGLTGRNSGAGNNPASALSAAASSSATSASTASRAARTGHAFPFQTRVQSSTALDDAHTDAWSVSFDGQGQVLISSGSDGVTKFWRKSVQDGRWLLFAGQEVLDTDADTDGDDLDGDDDHDHDHDGDGDDTD